MRNAFTIAGFFLLIVGAALVIFFTQNFDSHVVRSNTAQVIAAVPFIQLASGVHSKVAKRVNYSIRSQSDMADLWKLLDARNTPPTIDFSSQEVIAVFAGEKPDTGYKISVSKVMDADKRLVVVDLQNPASKCESKSVSTTPYEVVVVPLASLPLTHQDTSTVVTCSE